MRNISDEDSGVDTFRVVPAATDPGYVDILHALVDEWGIDVVIPSVSEELVLMAEAADELGAHVLIGPPRSVSVAADKYLTMQCLEQGGVPVPWFGLPSQFPSPAAAVEAAGGSVVVKPRVSRGGRGVHVLDHTAAWSRETLTYWAGLDDHSIVQRFAPGPEYAPVLFREQGRDEVDVCVVLEKTALREGRVGNAVGVSRPSTDDARAPVVADVARRAVLAAELTGPVDVDIRLREDDSPVVLEVNARFGANSAAAPELLDAVLAHAARVAMATAESA